jgi:hypothetical protein
MQISLETEKDIKDFLKTRISLTRKISIIRNLRKIEKKIKIKEQSQNKKFQQLPNDSSMYLNKRPNYYEKDKNTPKKEEEDQIKPMIFEIIKKEDETNKKVNGKNGKRLNVKVGPKRSRITLGPRSSTRPIQIMSSSEKPQEKPKKESLFQEFLGTFDVEDLFKKSDVKEESKSEFGFMKQTLPDMQIDTPAQFEKYIAILSLNMKIQKKGKEEEEIEEEKEDKDVHQNEEKEETENFQKPLPDENENNNKDAHPFVLLSQKLIQTETIEFKDRIRLLNQIKSAITDLSTKKTGSKLINSLTQFYLSNPKSKFEINRNWNEIKELVKSIENFTLGLISEVSSFELNNRPDSCLSIELSLQIDDVELKKHCLQNAIRFADKTVFNHIKEHFLDSELFKTVIIPFSKEQFLEYKKSPEEMPKEVNSKTSKEAVLIIQRKVGPLIFCAFYEKSLLDFLFEEIPDTNESIRNFFLKQWQKIFTQCIINKELLFKYFKAIIDILEKEVESEDKEKDKEEEINTNEEQGPSSRYLINFVIISSTSFGRRFLFSYIKCATNNEDFYYDILDLMSEIFERHFKNESLQEPIESKEDKEKNLKISEANAKKRIEITISSKLTKKPESSPPKTETLFRSFHSQLASIPFEQFLKLIESNELFSDILFHIFILKNKKLNSATDTFSFDPEMICTLLQQKNLNLGTFLAESSMSQYINDNLELGMDFLDSFLFCLEQLDPDLRIDHFCEQVSFMKLCNF